MTTAIGAIELAFVIAGLFALAWAIMTPNAGAGRRIAAGSFGIVALIIAAILGAEHHDREDC
jgi:hypothetical protein